MNNDLELDVSALETASAFDICAGLDDDMLRSLSEAQKTEVARLMARAAERSYRRGLQQGVHLAQTRPADLPADLHAWRYSTSADLSPWIEGDRGETAISRLHTENRQLAFLGFPDAILAGEHEIFVWPPKGLPE